MFDKQIIDGILEAWLADQSHPHRGRAQRPLPDPRDVKAILETVFIHGEFKTRRGKARYGGYYSAP